MDNKIPLKKKVYKGYKEEKNSNIEKNAWSCECRSKLSSVTLITFAKNNLSAVILVDNYRCRCNDKGREGVDEAA